MKQGVIFDMDGTLWDSSDHVAKSWDQVVRKEKNGLREITREDIQNVMGLTMTDIAKTLFPMLKEEEAIALTDRCGEYENAYLRMHGGVLYPRLEETLKILAERYPLYIVSNCQKGYIEAFLDYYGFWKYFQDTECFGNNNMGKAFNIGLVVKRNGIDHAVYVGDIQGDYRASKEAGVDFVHAAYGFGRIHEKVPAVAALEELPKMLEAVFSE
ncbi:phosphoglycolate phosphatase [Lachnospiraceae bacterium]|nr:phosphoglycolate phosphatase [Lachnospiraceae bacterium]